MAIGKQDISKIVALQEHDNLLDELREALRLIPEDITALRAQVSEEKQRLEEAKQNGQRLEMSKKERENEMAEKETAIKKHQTELNAIKTNDAFRALLKEIEDKKKSVDDLETEILSLLDEIDAAARVEEAAKDDLKRAEDENEKQVKVLEGRRIEKEGRLSAGEEKRKSFIEGIDGELLGLYDKTRERRDGVAISRIEGNSCSVCRVNQPPQVIVDANKGTKILTCESCQRILYLLETAKA
ncbi:MAG: C4-type zinc ribbon domain-containing protein [Elusimicrobiota bacterium]